MFSFALESFSKRDAHFPQKCGDGGGDDDDEDANDGIKSEKDGDCDGKGNALATDTMANTNSVYFCVLNARTNWS